MILASFDIGNTYVLIIGAALIMVLSYLYGVLSEKTNIPSVLMLILTGILIKLGLESMHVQLSSLDKPLEFLGIIGLIMIVLEAALDLEIRKEKLKPISNALLVAFLGLIGSAFVITGVFVNIMGMEFGKAILYATPLSIMSSAIIIPSVTGLVPHKREFMIYESAFSDILGIMMFYFIISAMDNGGGQATYDFFVSLIVTVVVAGAATFGLVYLFKDMKGHSKLFLLISILLLLYSLGKLLHLAPLIIILVFGLALANHQKVFTMFKNDFAKEDRVEKIEKEFHLITLETAFVVRTFFFVVFGMTIDLNGLLDLDVFLISAAIICMIYIVRIIILDLISKPNFFPEIYIAPRGLITILLLFNIPLAHSSDLFKNDIVLFVIIISSLIMTFSLISEKRRQARLSKEE